MRTFSETYLRIINSVVATNKQEVIAILSLIKEKKSFCTTEAYLNHNLILSGKDVVSLNCSMTDDKKKAEEKILYMIVDIKKYGTTVLEILKTFNNKYQMCQIKFKNSQDINSYYFEYNDFIKALIEFKNNGQIPVIYLNNINFKNINPVVKILIDNYMNIPIVISSNYLYEQNPKIRKVGGINFSQLEINSLLTSFSVSEIQLLTKVLSSEIEYYIDFLISNQTVDEFLQYIRRRHYENFSKKILEMTDNQRNALKILIEGDCQNIYSSVFMNKYGLAKSSMERSMEYLLSAGIIRKEGKNFFVFKNPYFKLFLKEMF